MAKRTLSFKFGAADQATGSRHIQRGTMVSARNVRQLKRGEYRKRRGFSLADLAETFVVDNVSYNRSDSVVSQTQWNIGSGSQGETTEDVLGTLVGQNTYIPWLWSAMGSGLVTVGFTGSVDVATNSCTLRLRVGGTTVNNPIVGGTEVASLALAIGSHNVDLVSSPFTAPAGVSYLVATVEPTAGTTDVTVASPHVWLSSAGSGQMVGLAMADAWATSFSEVVRAQWFVDFDQFADDVTSIDMTLAGGTYQAFGANATYRIRIGGTLNTADGDVAVSHSRTGDITGAGTLSSTTSTVARPSGVQLVKGTLIAGGAAAEMHGMSLLMRAS